MNELEQIMQVVQIYIYEKTGKKTRIYLRNVGDINKLKQAYNYIKENQHNKNYENLIINI
jgi:hypothetical protein